MPNVAPAASQSPRLKPRPIDLTFRRYGGSSGHDDEVGALAGFVAQTLIRNNERGAGNDHLRNRIAHLGRNLDAGEHLRRTLRRWRIARSLLLDLAPPHAAVAVAALFDIADMPRRFAGQGHYIPAQDGMLGSGEFQRREDMS